MDDNTRKEDFEWYGGQPNSHTVLIFGEIFEDKPPQSVLMHLGKEAYEAYEIFVYLKELIRVWKTDYICWSPAFEFLYAAIRVLTHNQSRYGWFDQIKKKFKGAGEPQNKLVFEEIGSTLFATIDKLNKIESIYKEGLDLHKLDFYGIEISQLFSDVAHALHKDFQITHYKKVSDLPKQTSTYVGRSYQATSYAFTSTQEFADWLCRLRFSLNGAWFNPNAGEVLNTVCGKRIILFDPDRMIQILNQRGYQVCLISSDIFTLGEIEFLSVWFFTHNFTDLELNEFQSILAKHNYFGYSHINLQSKASASLIRESANKSGAHANMIFSQKTSDRFSQTFNFGNANIVEQFAQYLDSLRPFS